LSLFIEAMLLLNILAIMTPKNIAQYAQYKHVLAAFCSADFSDKKKNCSADFSDKK
jgi:hypothetical protein